VSTEIPSPSETHENTQRFRRTLRASDPMWQLKWDGGGFSMRVDLSCCAVFELPANRSVPLNVLMTSNRVSFQMVG
jgi:hypothetical protein